MKIQLLGDNTYTPTYGTSGAAAVDFYLPKDVTVPPMRQGYKIPLQVAVELDPGTCLVLCARSSLGTNTMLRVSNAIGVIDSDYRGEISLVVDNMMCEPTHLAKGARICQGLIMPVRREPIEVVEALSQTDRGAGGFGSTGL